jgi:hypothetical protein
MPFGMEQVSPVKTISTILAEVVQQSQMGLNGMVQLLAAKKYLLILVGNVSMSQHSDTGMDRKFCVLVAIIKLIRSALLFLRTLNSRIIY